MALLAGVAALSSVGVAGLGSAPCDSAAQAPSKCISGESGTQRPVDLPGASPASGARGRRASSGRDRSNETGQPDSPRILPTGGLLISTAPGPARMNGIESVVWVLAFQPGRTGAGTAGGTGRPERLRELHGSGCSTLPASRRWLCCPSRPAHSTSCHKAARVGARLDSMPGSSTRPMARCTQPGVTSS